MVIFEKNDKADNLRILKNFFKDLPGKDIATLASLVKDVVKTNIKPVRIVVKEVPNYTKAIKVGPKPTIKRIKLAVQEFKQNVVKAIKVQKTQYVYIKYYSLLSVEVSSKLRADLYQQIYGENDDIPQIDLFNFGYHNLYHDDYRIDNKWRVIYIKDPQNIPPPLIVRTDFKHMSPGPTKLIQTPKLSGAIKIFNSEDIIPMCTLYLENVYIRSNSRESITYWSYEIFDNPTVITQLQDMPINKRVLNYDRFGKRAWETSHMKRNGSCGIEAIYDRFYDKQEKYRLKKWFANNGQMIKNFIRTAYDDDVNGIVISNDFEIQNNTHTEWDGRTTSASIIKKLCIAMNVSCYIASEDTELVSWYRSTRSATNDIALVGYIADGHFYRVDDAAKVQSLAQRARILKEIPKTLPIPGAENTQKYVYKNFSWETAKLIKVDSMKNRELLKFLDTEHKTPTCLVLNTTSLATFHEYMLSKHDRVINDNANTDLIKGGKYTRIIAREHIDDILIFLDKRGMFFNPSWTLSTVGSAELHETIPNMPENEEIFEFSMEEQMIVATNLANGYIQQDLAKNRDPSNNITAQEIYNMVNSIKRCQASYRRVYLSNVEDVIKASMDRINNKLPHTKANCRLTSLFDNIRRGDTPFHVYRANMGYIPNMISTYTNEYMKQFVGNISNQIKDKSVLKRFNNVKNEENLACLDVQKSYATCMYQGFLNNYVSDEFALDEYVNNGNQKYFNYPVYNMFDTVEVYDGGKLNPGKYYVEFDTASAATRNGIQYFEEYDEKDLMYFPNGWYNTPEVWYLRNKTNFKFTITKQYLSSNSLPYYIFRNFIKNIRRDFSKDAAKLIVNSLSGSFGKSVVTNAKKYVTVNKSWANHFMFKNFKNDFNRTKLSTGETKSGLKFYSIISEDRQLIQNNTLPIYNYIIGMGRIRQFHLYQLMKKVAPCRIIQFFTDSPLVEFNSREDVEKCYTEMAKYKGYRRSGYKILDQLQTAIPRATYKSLEQTWVDSKPDELTEYMIEELKKSDFPNKDAFIEQTKTWGGMKDGCAFEGLPGTAKSHMLKMVYDYHTKNGKRVLAVSYTNAAADRLRKDNIPAKTIHKGLSINQDTGKAANIPNIDVLLIDELLMCPSDVLATILELKRAGKFIVYTATDQYQLESINDKINIDKLYNSRVYGDLANWTKYTLNVCVRSDETMYKIYKSIADKRDVEHIMPWLENKKTTELSYTNLCYTNDKRIELNKECATIYCQGNGVEVVFKENASNGVIKDVTYPLIPMNNEGIAMPLIVTSSYKNVLTKGSRYWLHSWNEMGVYIVELGEDPIIIPPEIFINNMTLAFATTVHKCQGLTIHGKYKLHETNRYTWRMLYVAISRTTEEANILVA